jgi:DNA helicase-2/ATP-dependent DNA helicase PcrA
MDELHLTTCAERRMYGRTMPSQPSVFLQEVDKSCLQINKRSGGFAGGGRSFNPYNFNNSYGGSKVASFENSSRTSSKNSEVEERAGWKRGERVFHDDYGYGEVMEVRDSDDGPVVRVRFETGKETRFLSEYQGRAYEKIKGDY